MSIEFEWVPRSLNEYADSLSRVIDFDDWGVSTDFFAYISSLFGPFTVDRFPSPDSAKCARFYSKFWCPGAEGVDAFSVDWAGEINWLVPPIYLISRTIFIYRYAALGEFSLSQSGFQQLFGQPCFRWVDLGLPFFKWLNFLTLLLFLRQLGWSQYNILSV